MTDKSRGIWVRLNAAAFLDDKILRVGPAAELIFYRSIMFSKLMSSDGHVSATNLSQICHGLNRQRSRAIHGLTTERLWTPHDDATGWSVTNYGRYNADVSLLGPESTAEQVSAGRSKVRRRRQDQQKPWHEPEEDSLARAAPRAVLTNDTDGTNRGSNRTPPGSVRLEPAQAAPRGSEGAAQPAPTSEVVQSELEAARQKIAEAKSKARAATYRPSTKGSGREARVDFSATMAKLDALMSKPAEDSE